MGLFRKCSKFRRSIPLIIIYELKQSKKKGTLTFGNGFLIVLKFWEKLIPSRNKSLARKFFALKNFIKFWVFCGLFLICMNCFLIWKMLFLKVKFLEKVNSVFCVWYVSRRLPNNYNSKNVVSKYLYDENKLERCTTWKNNCWVPKYSWIFKCYGFFKISETLI